MASDRSTSDTYRFPDLDVEDRVHLQRLENLQGRERVIGWLRANVAVPLQHQFAEDFDEDGYYEAAADRYVEAAKDRSEGDDAE